MQNTVAQRRARLTHPSRGGNGDVLRCRKVSAEAVMEQRVGIADVAAEAGVSISTVSVALNDGVNARISPNTRERIREVAGRLGYVPNRFARALRGHRSGLVGFLGDRVATTPYAVQMILGAQETLRDAGVLMVLMDSQHDADLEER